MKHILYLPSWFPTRRDPYPGDFIKRHAEAASLYNRITVFYTAIDKNIKEPLLVEEKVTENFIIYIYYYPSIKGILSPVINGVKRFSALRKMYNKIFADSSPDLVHVHVAYPAGLFALYLKKRKGLEYVISEHDGIYMPGYDNYHVPGKFEKKIVPVICKNAKKNTYCFQKSWKCFSGSQTCKYKTDRHSKCCEYRCFSIQGKGEKQYFPFYPYFFINKSKKS